MRVLIAAALAVTLSATSLLAGTTAPLAPGKPAGVQNAQLMDNGLYYIIGVGVLGGVIVMATTSNGTIMNQASIQTGQTTGGPVTTF